MITTSSSPSNSLRLLLAACALSAGVGCAENEISVYIRQMKAPTLQGTTCIISQDPTTPFILEGTLDLAFKTHYILSPLIHSNLVSRIDTNANRTESNHIIIEGYVVEIHEDSPDGPLYAGTGFTNPFSVYQSTVILPGAGGNAGFGAGNFEAIPGQIGEALYQDVCVTRRGIVRPAGLDPNLCPVPIYNTDVTKRLVLGVSAFGHTGGGVSVETPKFNFPITVCCGCLVQFPTATSTTAATDAGAARGPSCAAGTVAATPAICYPGQDFRVDCNLCATSRPDLCQPFGYVPPTSGMITCGR